MNYDSTKEIKYNEIKFSYVYLFSLQNKAKGRTSSSTCRFMLEIKCITKFSHHSHNSGLCVRFFPPYNVSCWLHTLLLFFRIQFENEDDKEEEEEKLFESRSCLASCCLGFPSTLHMLHEILKCKTIFWNSKVWSGSFRFTVSGTWQSFSRRKTSVTETCKLFDLFLFVSREQNFVWFEWFMRVKVISFEIFHVGEINFTFEWLFSWDLREAVERSNVRQEVSKENFWDPTLWSTSTVIKSKIEKSHIETLRSFLRWKALRQSHKFLVCLHPSIRASAWATTPSEVLQARNQYSLAMGKIGK